MPEHVSCNLCGADSPRELYRLRDYRLWVDDVEWPLVRCTRCGLGYLSPRPSRDEVGRYYPREYFEHRHLAGATERYRRQAAYVPGPPRRLLDVGTAGGGFLAVMRDAGWDVEGLEAAGEDRSGNPHGLVIHRGHFPDDSGLPPASFDVVTAWAVFEHLHDPKRAFHEVHRLLAPGGLLVLQVPNLRSIWARYARQEDVPRHLYFFSPPVLRAYGEACGLTLTRVVHTTDLFGGSGRGVLGLWLVRALGGSDADYFRLYRMPRGERFRRRPAAAAALAAVARLERVLLPDPLVRALRISGQIVALFEKRAA